MASTSALDAARLRVVLFGATGMVGSGVLRECLLSPTVDKVLSVTRRPTGTPPHPKLQELVHGDFKDFSPIADTLRSCNACFWCLGITSAGLTEQQYTEITHDYTVAAARQLDAPSTSFVLVTGQGSDRNSSVMWARVKAKAEDAILEMPFVHKAVFRPGMIQPLHGIESRTTSYRVMYKVLGPIIPLVKACAPGSVTSTQNIGRAMLQCALAGPTTPINTNADINALAASFEASAAGKLSSAPDTKA